eukprot:jgi/Bigna1/73216/fgenesh1_pg.23_\
MGAVEARTKKKWRRFAPLLFFVVVMVNKLWCSEKRLTDVWMPCLSSAVLKSEEGPARGRSELDRATSRLPLNSLEDLFGIQRRDRSLSHSRLRYRRGAHDTRVFKRTNATTLLQAYLSNKDNIIPDMFPGCYYAHYNASWLQKVEKLSDPQVSFYKAKGMEADDIILDPEELHLSALNMDPKRDKIIYLSLLHPLLTNGDEALAMGKLRDDDASEVDIATTLLLVLKPRTCMRIGTVILGGEFEGLAPEDIRIETHVSLRTPAMESNDGGVSSQHSPPVQMLFPLPDCKGPFLCIQGANGSLTHFEAPNYHAIDLLCPVGTEVLAGCDGFVHRIVRNSTARGLRCSYLFQANSITLRTDSGQFIEYVHIDRPVSGLNVGDRVKAGNTIAYSGEIGFTPSPHLHVEAASSISTSDDEYDDESGENGNS